MDITKNKKTKKSIIIPLEVHREIKKITLIAILAILAGCAKETEPEPEPDCNCYTTKYEYVYSTPPDYIANYRYTLTNICTGRKKTEDFWQYIDETYCEKW